MGKAQIDIKQIAKLARLDLTEAELKKYGDQLSGILKYIEQLNEVDTATIDPTAQVTGLVNVMREDAVKDWDESEKKAALEQAPGGLEKNQMKVKRVLD